MTTEIPALKRNKSKKRKISSLYNDSDEKQILPYKTKKNTLLDDYATFIQNPSEALLFFADNDQWDSVEWLIDVGWVTSQMLDDHSDQGINLLWNMACVEKWGLIRKLVESQLVTSKMLGRLATGEHNDKGINALWWIAKSKQWSLFKMLINQGIITVQMLLAHPKDDTNEHKGTNILWWIASDNKWNLMKILMGKELVTPELLLSGGNSDLDRGINILWLMAFSEEWDPIHELIKKEIVTPQMLSACAETEEEYDKGINVLWLIANKKKWNLLQDLITRGLVSAPMLLASPKSDEHPSQGANTLYLMAINQQWDLIGSLVSEINTQTLLSEPNDKEANALTLILESMQIDLIKQLLESPLAPLQQVPWNKFDAKLLMHKLMEVDQQTFGKLTRLDVSHPQVEDEKKAASLIDKKVETNARLIPMPEALDKQSNIISNILDLIKTENLEGFKKLLEEKRQTLPDKENLLPVIHKIVQKNNPLMLEALVTSLGESRVIPNIDDFRWISQDIYWYWQREKNVLAETILLEFIVEEFTECGSGNVAENLKSSIQYLASGNQEGIYWGFCPPTKLSDNSNRTPEPKKEYKKMVEDHLQVLLSQGFFTEQMKEIKIARQLRTEILDKVLSIPFKR